MSLEEENEVMELIGLAVERFITPTNMKDSWRQDDFIRELFFKQMKPEAYYTKRDLERMADMAVDIVKRINNRMWDEEENVEEDSSE